MERRLTITMKGLEELERRFEVAEEWRLGRAEGMIKKMYALYCYIRDKCALPPATWFKSSLDFRPPITKVNPHHFV